MCEEILQLSQLYDAVEELNSRNEQLTHELRQCQAENRALKEKANQPLALQYDRDGHPILPADVNTHQLIQLLGTKDEEIAELKSDIEDLVQSKRAPQEVDDGLQQTLASTQAELASVRERLSQTERQHAGLLKAHVELEDILETRQHENSFLKGNVHNLQGKLNGVEAELNELTVHLEERLLEDYEVKRVADKKVLEATAQSSQLRTVIKAKSQAVTTLRQQIEIVSMEREDVACSLAGYVHTLSTYHDRSIQDWRDRCEEHISMNQGMNDHIGSLERQLERLSNENQALHAQISGLNDNLQDKMGEFTASMDNQRFEFEDMERKMVALHKQLQVNSDAKRQMDAERKALTHEMETQQEDLKRAFEEKKKKMARIKHLEAENLTLQQQNEKSADLLTKQSDTIMELYDVIGKAFNNVASVSRNAKRATPSPNSSPKEQCHYITERFGELHQQVNKLKQELKCKHTQLETASKSIQEYEKSVADKTQELNMVMEAVKREEELQNLLSKSLKDIEDLKHQETQNRAMWNDAISEAQKAKNEAMEALDREKHLRALQQYQHQQMSDAQSQSMKQRIEELEALVQESKAQMEAEVGERNREFVTELEESRAKLSQVTFELKDSKTKFQKRDQKAKEEAKKMQDELDAMRKDLSLAKVAKSDAIRTLQEKSNTHTNKYNNLVTSYKQLQAREEQWGKETQRKVDHWGSELGKLIQTIAQKDTTLTSQSRLIETLVQEVPYADTENFLATSGSPSVDGLDQLRVSYTEEKKEWSRITKSLSQEVRQLTETLSNQMRDIDELHKVLYSVHELQGTPLKISAQEPDNNASPNGTKQGLQELGPCALQLRFSPPRAESLDISSCPDAIELTPVRPMVDLQPSSLSTQKVSSESKSTPTPSLKGWSPKSSPSPQTSTKCHQCQSMECTLAHLMASYGTCKSSLETVHNQLNKCLDFCEDVVTKLKAHAGQRFALQHQNEVLSILMKEEHNKVNSLRFQLDEAMVRLECRGSTPQKSSPLDKAALEEISNLVWAKHQLLVHKGGASPISEPKRPSSPPHAQPMPYYHSISTSNGPHPRRSLPDTHSLPDAPLAFGFVQGVNATVMEDPNRGSQHKSNPTPNPTPTPSQKGTKSCKKCTKSVSCSDCKPDTKRRSSSKRLSHSNLATTHLTPEATSKPNPDVDGTHGTSMEPPHGPHASHTNTLPTKHKRMVLKPSTDKPIDSYTGLHTKRNKPS